LEGEYRLPALRIGIAIVRKLQRVRISGGRVASVITRATFAAGIECLRRRPILSSSPARPRSSKRFDLIETRFGVVPSRNLDHLSIAAGTLQKMVLQALESLWQFDEWRAISHRPPGQVMGPLDDPRMFTEDLSFRSDDNSLRVDPHADRSIGEGGRHAVAVTFQVNEKVGDTRLVCIVAGNPRLYRHEFLSAR
jgi:hypothetical protein